MGSVGRRGMLATMAEGQPVWQVPYALGHLGRGVAEPLRAGALRALRHYFFLRRSAPWPLERLQAYQASLLQRQVTLAARHVPYYEDLFRRLRLDPAKIRGPGDLRRLPVLTKQDVRDNLDRLITRRLSPEELEARRGVTHTSGSSGTPLTIYIDREQQHLRMAHCAFYLGLMGCSRRQRFIKVWSRPFIEGGLEQIALHQPYLRMLSLSSVPRDSGRVDAYLDWIRAFRPGYVAGPPSFLYGLALAARDRGRRDARFPVFMACFENLYGFQRQVIEQQFGCKAFRYYSSEEDLFYAVECRRHSGLHVDIRKGVLDVVDPAGEPRPPGERGRLVATGLHNELMPLLRYDMGDLGTMASEPCGCGLGLPSLSSLDGRAGEALELRGKLLYPATLAVVLERRDGVRECQFVRLGHSRLGVRLVAGESYQPGVAAALAHDLEGLVDPGLVVEVELVERIPRGPGGKFHLVRDEAEKGRAA